MLKLIIMGTIYKIENNINGKVYIGQTIQELKIRFKRHCSFSALSKEESNMPIKRAIKKYGKENFTISVIEECDNSIINEREIFWIKKHNSFKNGYNATLGGGGLYGYWNNIKGVDIDEIIEKYKSGIYINTLSKEYSISRQSIRDSLRRNNVELRSATKCHKIPIEIQKVIDLLNEGKSQRQIGREIGRCQGTVWKLIKQLEQNTSTSVWTLSVCTEG